MKDEYTTCANQECKRTLSKIKHFAYPSDRTRKEDIHSWTNRQAHNYSLLCPNCGHYTMAIHVGK